MLFDIDLTNPDEALGLLMELNSEGYSPVEDKLVSMGEAFPEIEIKEGIVTLEEGEDPIAKLKAMREAKEGTEVYEVKGNVEVVHDFICDEEEIDRFYDGEEFIYHDLMGQYTVGDAKTVQTYKLAIPAKAQKVVDKSNKALKKLCGWNMEKTFVDSNGMENRVITIVPLRCIPIDAYTSAYGLTPSAARDMVEVTPDSLGIELTEHPNHDYMDEYNSEMYEVVRVHYEFVDLKGKHITFMEDVGYYVDYKGPAYKPNTGNKKYDEWAYTKVQTMLRFSGKTEKKFKKSTEFLQFIAENMEEPSDVGYFQRLVTEMPESLIEEKEIELICPDLGGDEEGNITITETFRSVPLYVEAGFESPEDLRYDDFCYLTGRHLKDETPKKKKKKKSSSLVQQGRDRVLRKLKEQRGEDASRSIDDEIESMGFDPYNLGPVRPKDGQSNNYDKLAQYLGNKKNVEEDPHEAMFRPITENPFLDEDGNCTLGNGISPLDKYSANENIPIFKNVDDLPEEFRHAEEEYLNRKADEINENMYCGLNIIKGEDLTDKGFNKFKKKAKKKKKKQVKMINPETGKKMSKTDIDVMMMTNRMGDIGDIPFGFESMEELANKYHEDWHNARRAMMEFVEKAADAHVVEIYGEFTGNLVDDKDRLVARRTFIDRVTSKEYNTEMNLAERNLDSIAKAVMYYGESPRKLRRPEVMLRRKYMKYLRTYCETPDAYFKKMYNFSKRGLLNLDLTKKDGVSAAELLGGSILTPDAFDGNSALAKILAMEHERHSLGLVDGSLMTNPEELAYLRDMMTDIYGHNDSEAIRDAVLSDVQDITEAYGDTVANLSGYSFSRALSDFSEGLMESNGDDPEEAFMRALKTSYPDEHEELGHQFAN